MTLSRINRCNLLLGLFTLPLGLTNACSAGNEFDEPSETLGQAAQPLKTVAQKQALMNQFYALGHYVNVSVTMLPQDWTLLKNEVPPTPDPARPFAGVCNYDHKADAGNRFKSYNATVTVTTSADANVPQISYTGSAKIKKKSFCGSYTGPGAIYEGAGHFDKPGFKLELDTDAEEVLGTRYLVLNNNVQDAAYIRQALGYKLYAMAGLPHSRSNLASVMVNGAKAEDGLYTSVEPIRERYLDNPDNHFLNTSGSNLYELENDDLLASRLPYIDAESLSKYHLDSNNLPVPGYQKDLSVAINAIKTSQDCVAKIGTANPCPGDALAEMKDVMDVNHFISIYAMEFLLKHGDGFTIAHNNTYLYNDVSVVPTNPQTHHPVAGKTAAQDPPQINFKLIPWGIDGILRAKSNFVVSQKSTLGKLVRNDTALLAKFNAQVQAYRKNVFGRSQLSGQLKAAVDDLTAQLQALLPSTAPQLLAVAEVTQQLDLIRSAGLIVGGFDNTTGLYVLDKELGDALHMSNSQSVPPGVTPVVRYEVVHRPRQDSSQDRWFFSTSSSAHYAVSNEGTSWWLHSAGAIRTPYGHPYVYATSFNDPTYQDYNISVEQIPSSTGEWKYTGYFKLQNQHTFRWLHFGINDDPTPTTGAQRVYGTDLEADGTSLRWF